MLGWDEKWTFVEHRFMRNERVVGVVVMRGLFRSSKGTVSPRELVREMGIEETSPPMPQWLTTWSESCDEMSRRLREEEGRPVPAALGIAP